MAKQQNRAWSAKNLEGKPNILIVMTDQHRFDTIGAVCNNFNAKTPNIDKLVNRGVTFENAFCTAPVCCPSRATLMTGLHPSRAGVPGNSDAPLNEGIGTIGDRMQAHGYETVYHGKSHLKGSLANYGFEIAYENSHDESTRIEAGRYWRNRDWITSKRPFFHVVSFLDPHDIYFLDGAATDPKNLSPWENSSDDLKNKPSFQRKKRMDWSEERWQYYRRFYAERLERVDNEIGKLLDELYCSGYGCNTWVIFTADHGDMGGEHGIPFKGPFMYEGVMHVPLIIAPPDNTVGGKWKTVAKGGAFKPSLNGGLASLIDIVPTVMDLAGLPADPGLPGKSLVPALEGKAIKGHDAVFCEWTDGVALRCVRTKNHKYVVYENGEEELYDLKADPAEMNNLTSDKASQKIRKELRRLLKAHLQEEGDSFIIRDKGQGTSNK